jgi:hypothetical protein
MPSIFMVQVLDTSTAQGKGSCGRKGQGRAAHTQYFKQLLASCCSKVEWRRAANSLNGPLAIPEISMMKIPYRKHQVLSVPASLDTVLGAFLRPAAAAAAAAADVLL